MERGARKENAEKCRIMRDALEQIMFVAGGGDWQGAEELARQALAEAYGE